MSVRSNRPRLAGDQPGRGCHPRVNLPYGEAGGGLATVGDAEQISLDDAAVPLKLLEPLPLWGFLPNGRTDDLVEALPYIADVRSGFRESARLAPKDAATATATGCFPAQHRRENTPDGEPHTRSSRARPSAAARANTCAHLPPRHALPNSTKTGRWVLEAAVRVEAAAKRDRQVITLSGCTERQLSLSRSMQASRTAPRSLLLGTKLDSAGDGAGTPAFAMAKQ
jgi:hypothetical protein